MYLYIVDINNIYPHVMGTSDKMSQALLDMRFKNFECSTRTARSGMMTSSR